MALGSPPQPLREDKWPIAHAGHPGRHKTQLRSEDEILLHGPKVAAKRVDRELAPLYMEQLRAARSNDDVRPDRF